MRVVIFPKWGLILEMGGFHINGSNSASYEYVMDFTRVTAISVNNSLLDLPPSSFFGIRSDDLLFLIHSASTT